MQRYDSCRITNKVFVRQLAFARLLVASCIVGFFAILFAPSSALAQANPLCSGQSPTAYRSSTTPIQLSHPDYEEKGWKVMLRLGPSMDCGADPIWADDNLRVEQRGTYVGTDQSWSLLRFSHNGATLERWAETRFLEVAGGSGGCTGASPSTVFSTAKNRTLSHPEYEAQGWKVMLRQGPSMDCGADPIWADDNLPVQELGTFAGLDQSWSLLRFTHNGSTRQRWAESRFLSDANGSGGCSGASPSLVFDQPQSRTLSHPEYEARGWKVMLRTGPSMDCGSDPLWADDNLQVEQLGTYAGVDQSWSLLEFYHNGAPRQRWAETKFLESAGGVGGCSGASPSTTFSTPQARTLSHPEYEARGWKVMLRTGPSMDCGSDPIWADDNLPVEELGTYIGVDQSWSLLRFSHNGRRDQRWAETSFLETGGNPGPPVGPLPDGIPIVIYDTDMGPDIDDALGLAALHAYANQGKAHIAAVTLSRNSNTGARYIDLLNTFYARPDIPIGVYRGTTASDTAEHGYTRDIVNSGKYAQTLDVNSIPQGHLLMRDVLRAAPDNSVVIIQVGFSTNTARLLEEYPDLVARKARLLSVMAGEFDMPSGAAGSFSEFNVRTHPGSARTVFSRWPVELVVSEFNLGSQVLYPLSSIRNDFNYVENHPIKDSYLNSTYDWHQPNGDSYDMRSWDITSVVAAIEPHVIPKVLGPGKVTVSDSSLTSFSHGNGAHYVLAEGSQLNSAQRQQLVNLMIELTSSPPANHPTASLDVSIAENPFRCNGALRTVAVVSGFQDNESVIVNVNGTDYPARAASGGRRTVSWSCENGGSSLRFIARGLSSGLQASFSVQTHGSAGPVCAPAAKRENPGGEILDHVIVTQHAVSVSEPMEPFEEGCRGTQKDSFDAGERVQTRGFAGGYLQLLDRSWIRSSAVGPVQPLPEPPPGLADTVSRSAQTLLDVIEDEIDRSPIDEEVDDEYLAQCYKLILRHNIPAAELDLSSGVACIQTASISMYRSSRNTKWFDDIIEELLTKLIPGLEQEIDDFIDNPIVEVLGISDVFRCADGQEGHYCIYAAAGVIPKPVGKLPRVLSFLRSARVPNRLSAAATRFSDDAARFARYCRVSGVNSFHKDTLVSVEAGFVPISQIEIGDLVWAYNEKSAGQSLQPVLNLISGEGEKVLVEIILDHGESITATGGHPFYLPGSKTWANAEDLKKGQRLLGRDGSLIEIAQIIKRTEDLKVYNLTVANDHTYYAGASAVLNHNAGGCKFPKWTTTSTNHLRGEFNAAGRFVGYHSRYLGKDRAGVRIFERSTANNKGIYTARVEALKDSGEWVRKTARSTFFPDSWALDRIQREVKNAYATARLNGQTGTILTEKSSTGFDILIQVDTSDNIIRAHPQL